MIRKFDDIISKAGSGKLKTLSVAVAQDDAVLEAVKIAKERGIADAILVGDEAQIRKIADSLGMDLEVSALWMSRMWPLPLLRPWNWCIIRKRIFC